MFSISDATVIEGDEGTVQAVFSVELSEPSEKPVSVHFRTTELGTARPGSDYVPVKDKLITFDPGTRVQSVSVDVVGDRLVENDEYFFVTLFDPTNAVVRTGGIGRIQDDDVYVSINDARIVEGDDGYKNAVFTVELSKPSPWDVEISYRTQDGTATSSVVNRDYSPEMYGKIRIKAGTTRQTISVPVYGDTQVERDETFFVEITGATNARIIDGKGTGLILNDDIPDITINDVGAFEGDGQTAEPSKQVNLEFTVRLSQPSHETVQVDYTTAPDTATNADFSSTAGTLTFAPGETAKTIVVPVKGELLIEDHERFFVRLGDPVNAAIQDNEGIGLILNDDYPEPTTTIQPTGSQESEESSWFDKSYSAEDIARFIWVDNPLNKATTTVIFGVGYVAAQAGATVGEGAITVFIRVPEWLGIDMVSDSQWEDMNDTLLWEKVHDGIWPAIVDIWN